LNFLTRFPAVAQILPVYGVIVLIVHGWTLLWFAYRFPSWRFFLTLDEILGILAYSMAANLLESLLVLLVPLSISFLLARRWFGEFFIAGGSALVIFLLGIGMWINYQMMNGLAYSRTLILGLAAAVLLSVLLSVLVGKQGLLRKLFEVFADRASIFVYLSLPVDIIALVYVLWRNLF